MIYRKAVLLKKLFYVDLSCDPPSSVESLCPPQSPQDEILIWEARGMTSAAPILYLVMRDTLLLPCQDVQSDPSSTFYGNCTKEKEARFTNFLAAELLYFLSLPSLWLLFLFLVTTGIAKDLALYVCVH